MYVLHERSLIYYPASAGLLFLAPQAGGAKRKLQLIAQHSTDVFDHLRAARFDQICFRGLSVKGR